MRRRQEIILTAIAIIALALIAGPRVAATVIIDESSLVLLAGEGITLGRGTSLAGAIAAGQEISIGAEAVVESVYTEDKLEVGRGSVVRGRVLANKSADAGRELDFQGPSWTGESVHFGREAQVIGDVIAAAGTIAIDRDAWIVGDLLGNGSIRIDRDSAVYGDASPGMGYGVSTGHNVTITGSTAAGAVVADTFELPEIGPVPTRDPYGFENIRAHNNSSTVLDPGAYRKVDFGNHATVVLSAGVYDLKDFRIGNDGVLNVDTTAGDVVVNADGLRSGRDLKVNMIGDGRFSLNAYSPRGVWFGKDSYVEADVHVYGGGFRAGSGVRFQGSVAATADVTFGDNSAVLLAQMAGGVPEPGAAALLAAGAVLIAWRKRSRTHAKHQP